MYKGHGAGTVWANLKPPTQDQVSTIFSAGPVLWTSLELCLTFAYSTVRQDLATMCYGGVALYPLERPSCPCCGVG